MKRLFRSRGFSLIEVIVYIALFALLMTGALSGFVAIGETAARNQGDAIRMEEGTFLERRIAVAISDSKGIAAPLPNQTSSTLTLVEDAGSYALRSSTLIENGAALSSSDLSVSDLIFTAVSATVADPTHVRFSFTLTSHYPTVASTSFSRIVYLSP